MQVVINKARERETSILRSETPRRDDDSMRTGTYLISTLILNYLMAHSGPGVRQMSTVIKFNLNEAVGRRGQVYEFLTFINCRRLALTGQSVGMELSLCARVVYRLRTHSLLAQIIHGQHFIISYNNNLLL